MSARRTSLLAVLALAAIPLVTGLTGSGQAAGAFPSIGENGVTFSASVPSDVQRDEGEPEISIDPAGNIYTCGPSGFSNIADYAQVSRDGGDQFHLLGQPPRGQITNTEGGGDCGLASAPEKNPSDQYTWAYTGLGPLTNFSTGTSENTGQTLRTSPISESPVGVDRQWLVFTDEKTVFLNYNRHVPRDLIRGLGPDDEFGRPTQIDAVDGTRLYEAVAYSFTSPLLPEAMTYLYPVDNAPAMDFLLGAGTGPAPVPNPNPDPQPGSGGGNPNPNPAPGAGPGSTPATGGLGAPVLALLVTATAVLAVRRRRRTAE